METLSAAPLSIPREAFRLKEEDVQACLQLIPSSAELSDTHIENVVSRIFDGLVNVETFQQVVSSRRAVDTEVDAVKTSIQLTLDKIGGTMDPVARANLEDSMMHQSIRLNRLKSIQSMRRDEFEIALQCIIRAFAHRVPKHLDKLVDVLYRLV